MAEAEVRTLQKKIEAVEGELAKILADIAAGPEEFVAKKLRYGGWTEEAARKIWEDLPADKLLLRKEKQQLREEKLMLLKGQLEPGEGPGSSEGAGSLFKPMQFEGGDPTNDLVTCVRAVLEEQEKERVKEAKVQYQNILRAIATLPLRSSPTSSTEAVLGSSGTGSPVFQAQLEENQEVQAAPPPPPADQRGEFCLSGWHPLDVVMIGGNSTLYLWKRSFSLCVEFASLCNLGYRPCNSFCM